MSAKYLTPAQLSVATIYTRRSRAPHLLPVATKHGGALRFSVWDVERFEDKVRETAV